MMGPSEQALRRRLSPNVPGVTVDLHPITRPANATVSSAPTVAIGRVLRERYVIQERLGHGGKGTVYKALDLYRSALPHSQQHVALKVLHTGGDGAQQLGEDLRRELHCGQELSHRNIVNVFELDRDGDIVFFTMEFLEGELLGDLIARLRPATLRRPQAWQIIQQLGSGLEHAHERGIVHGDLKPQNIMVTRAGEVRILDFGAAKKVIRAPSDGEAPDCAPIAATPAYASCELLEGRPADPRDDIYALACICYELVSGVHPFECRPATVARDFGVKAPRPVGLTGQQWRTLQRGLSWHRAGRSMSVRGFIARLTHAIGDNASMTPLLDLKAAHAKRSWFHSPAAAAMIAVFLVAAVSIAELRNASKTKSGDLSVTSTAGPLVKGDIVEATPPPAVTASAGARVEEAPPLTDARPLIANKLPAPPLQTTISVDGYHVSSGDRFVEIRVHRNQLQKNASFTWWTESATAKQNIDFVQQTKAIQTFAPARRSTRFYVKLLPESGRAQPDYFYVAIAQPGHSQTADKITRLQIWLPTPRDELQANR
jgi:serine/threonine protein kinase